MTQLPIEDVAAAVEAAARIADRFAEMLKQSVGGPGWTAFNLRVVDAQVETAENIGRSIRAATNQIACPSGGERMPKVHHLGAALQGIADEHANVLTPRQIEALYQAAKKLWSPPDPAVGATVRELLAGNLAHEINRLYLNAAEKPCRCVSDPEGYCPQCDTWGSASSQTEKLLLAALARAGGSEVRREGDRTAWLLENENGSGPPVWLRLKEPQVGVPGIRAADKFNARMWQDMTADANEALAFSRKEDAEMFLELLKPRGQWLRAAEHKFIRALSDQEGDG